MLNFFRKSASRKALGLQMYGELIARSRAPVFFREFGVADTIGFDEAMREQGQGDMGLGRKMRQFADAWYGRLSVYSGAKDTASLAAALSYNLYRGGKLDDRAMTLAEYAIAAREHLRYAPDGRLEFGPLPSLGAP